MAFSLIWLPGVLKAAGLKVVEQPGWQTRGIGDMGAIKGILCHHTAHGPNPKSNAPSLGVVMEGRPDLRPPLAQLVLGRDGTYYVVAAGKAQHAGKGDWPGVGVNGGNARLIGIEAENTGLADDHPWPSVQIDDYVKGCAAILNHLGLPASMCIGHLEYALPVGRKSDPSFSVGNRVERLKAMEDFRQKVSVAMTALKGAAQPSAPKPTTDASKKTGTVIPPDLNMRAEASAASEVLQVLRRGTLVTIIGERMNGNDKWYHVNVGGLIGWAAARFIKQVGA